MSISKFALLFVIFVDVFGQTIIIPIINTIVMDPSAGFLPAGTPEATRHLDFGLVIGAFYLSWFLGVVYVSKLSDSVGRKRGILICLAGALAGYVFTILAIASGSLWLMILGRVVTGFTAGNQPIAQAALVDLSGDDADKTRNMGYVVTALSVGFIAGPIVAGVLSDQHLLGDLASLSLPFYVALGLVVIAIGLIVFRFEERLESRSPLTVGPLDIFRLLWKITQNPTVLKISTVFFFFMFVWNTGAVFVDNYLTSRFGIGTTGNSAIMLVFGATLAYSSAVLVAKIGERFSKLAIVAGTTAVMALAAAIIVMTPWVAVIYVAAIPYAAGFAIGYATLLSIFSASVDASEQGWVMGVSTALWTLGAGLTSVLSGELIGLDLALPFVLAIVSALLALAFIATLWRSDDMRRITARQ